MTGQYQPPAEINVPVFALSIPTGSKGVIVYFSFGGNVTGTATSEFNKGDKFIDISKWQEKINARKLKQVGRVDKAMIRLSYGETPDEMANINWEIFKDAEILRSGYHYWENRVNIDKQYDVFMSGMGDDVGEIECMLDIEDRVPAITKVELDKMQIWLDKVERATGRKSIFYTGQSVYDWKTVDWVTNYKLHKAQYTNGVCTPLAHWGYPEMWQFSSRGRLPGIDGNVDFNMVRNGETEPQRDWWYRGVTTEPDIFGNTYPNFTIKSTVPKISIYDAPHGKLLFEKNVTWPMVVQELTLDGWLKVHFDGKSDWWVRYAEAKLA